MSKRHKVKGPTPDERQRMVNDAMKSFIPLLGQQKQVSDIDELFAKFKRFTAKVDAHFVEIDKAVKLAGQDHDRKMLREEAQRMFLEELYKYSKEETLLILTCVAAERAVAQIV